jgi:hypothetical protein
MPEFTKPETKNPRVGERFNPYGRFNGCYVPEAIARYRGLSPGSKLAYGRFVRYAGKDGAVYPSMPTLGTEIGCSENQARSYVTELIEHRFIEVARRSGRVNTYYFVWHKAFNGDVGSAKFSPKQKTRTPSGSCGGPPQDAVAVPPQDAGGEESHLKTVSKRRTATKLITPHESKSDSHGVSGAFAARSKKTNGGKSDSKSPSVIESNKSDNRRSSIVDSVSAPKKQPAFRGDWDDDELELMEDFLSSNEPIDPEDHNDAEWVPAAVLDAGMGADPADVLSYLESKIAAGWTATNWRAYPAAVHHEFQRRANKTAGVRWSKSDLVNFRADLATFLGDEPPEQFSDSCELAANGASAREVFDLLERRLNDPKYRPGGKHEPRTWNWFYQTIRNEFNPAERGRLPEPPARVRHSTADQQAFAAGLDALELPDAS